MALETDRQLACCWRSHWEEKETIKPIHMENRCCVDGKGEKKRLDLCLLLGAALSVINQPSALSLLHASKTVEAKILLKSNSPHGDGDQSVRDVRVNWRFKNISESANKS